VSAAVPYRADIDGLRAIAVAAVVLFHAKVGPFTGGFVGVDVFFVISGFLITSILVKEMSAGTFSLANFYERRVRRIFPALFTVVLACAVAGWFILTPRDYRDFGWSMAYMGVFISNVFFRRRAGYFGPAAETQPLLHTWSLAVEEQFYVLAPIALFGLFHYAWHRRRPVIVVLAVASLAAAAYGVNQQWTSTFYQPQARAWELMTGMLLAVGVVPTVSNRRIAGALGLLGLAMIAWSVTVYTPATPFPGFAALLPCLGAALVIHSGAAAQTSAQRFLSLPPIVFTGKISYSLYLWHWPLLVFGAYAWGRDMGARERLALIAVAIVLSVLTWAAIETPARTKVFAKSRRSVLALGLAAIAISVTAGFAIRRTEGVIARLSPEARAFAELAMAETIPDEFCPGSASGQQKSVACPIGNAVLEPVSFVLWGDSHAAAITMEMSEVAAHFHLNGVSVFGPGCPPILGLEATALRAFSGCRRQNLALNNLLKEPTIRRIILVARWAAYTELDNVGGGIRIKIPHFDKSDSTANRKAFFEGLRNTVRTITESGRQLTIIGPVPELPFDLPSTVIKDMMHGKSGDHSIQRIDFERRQSNFRLLLDEFANVPGVQIIEPSEILCDNTTCKTVENGEALYLDDNHLSRTGARRLHSLFERTLEPLAAANR
jgi:peptidoglycan/LPS O-acetylase OafA/YrhL